jgi:ethanolamine utilization protein EutA (predicted chaperonin)
MFKRRRNKETNRRDEKENRRTEKENRRNERRFGKDLRTPTDSHNVYEEECTELLKELLELSSKEASLIFELSQLLEEAKIETIRLSGLIASCKLEDKELASELYKEFEKMFSKYVKKGE